MNELILYRHPLSGHSHKVELFIALLGLKVKMKDVDLFQGEQKTLQFRELNLFGEIPVLKDGDYILADSNAILVYLANKYDGSGNWCPEAPEVRASIQRFLSIAAGPLVSGPAAARLATVFNMPLNHLAAIEKSLNLLGHLDAYLADSDWLVGNNPTIADIALYTYIAHAPEGDVPLDEFFNLQHWLVRIELLPGFVPMRSVNSPSVFVPRLASVG